MKLGVRAHDFGRYTADALAEMIKKEGFECVQLAPAKAITGIEKIADINAVHLEEIKNAFTRCELGIAVLGCYIEPSIVDEAVRLENVRIFCDNLRHAKVIGAGVVGTETTRMDTAAPAEEREKAYARLKDSVLRMVEMAESVGVPIGIEPVAEHTLNTPKLTRRLLDEVKSDKLRLIFDPANLLLPETIHEQGRIFTEMFELNGNDIAVMHIKNIVIENGEKIWSNIGKGVIDYAPVFAWLRKNTPEMTLLCDQVRMDSYKEDLNTLRNYAEGRF